MYNSIQTSSGKKGILSPLEIVMGISDIHAWDQYKLNIEGNMLSLLMLEKIQKHSSFWLCWSWNTIYYPGWTVPDVDTVVCPNTISNNNRVEQTIELMLDEWIQQDSIPPRRWIKSRKGLTDY